MRKKTSGGAGMEDRIEYLIELVEKLFEKVERLERLMVSGRARVGVQGLRERRLSAQELSDQELKLLKVFFEWARGRWSEWVSSYEEGKLEGYDSKRDLVILRKGTIVEFLDIASDLGYRKHEVLGLLADLGVLRFWERGGKRQYCIAIRVDKPVRTRVHGYYVLDLKRMREVSEELRGLLSGGVSEGFVEGEVDAL